MLRKILLVMSMMFILSAGTAAAADKLYDQPAG